MSLCQYLGGFLHCFNHCSRRSSNSAKTGLRLQSFSRSCIIGGRFFRSRSKTAAYLKTNGKKDIRLRPCRSSKMYLRVHFWLRLFCGTKNSAVLTGGQWFHAVSSYVNLQHPCCKLTCEFCKSKTSFLPNTPAILGGSEQNSKQPNVHGCTFGCDGIRGGSELAFLSIKTDNKCSEPYDDFSLIHLEDPIRQNLS